jgi:DNA polymerase-3 subunit gamma/tau
MLTKEAFNALLKTLEEPPDHVVFIFATTEPHKVPPTIISRCQRFDFRRISTQEIIESLRTICKAEKISIDDEAIQLISMKADGSLRDSQSILDQMISYTEGTISGEQVIKALGLIEQDVFFQITDIVNEKDIKKGIQVVEDIVSKGYDIEEFLNGLEDHLRNLLFVISTQNTEILQTSETYKKRYLTQVEKFEEGDILRLIKITSDAKAKLRRDVQPRFQLELAVVKMIKMDKTVTVEDLIAQIKEVAVKMPLQTEVPDKNPSEKKNLLQEKPDITRQEKSAEKVKTEQKTSQDGQPEKKKSLTLEQIRDQWPEFISRIKHKKITIGSFLAEGVLYDLKGKNIEVVFGLDNTFHIDAINRSKNIVSEVLKEVFKQDLYIKCQKKDLPKSEKKKMMGNEKEKKLEDLLEKDKSLKDLVDDIDAKLIS